MRVLLVHRSFPGQFRYLAATLAQMGHEVFFLTTAVDGEEIPGVKRILYKPQIGKKNSHHYIYNIENAVLYGQAAYQAAASLKKAGWYPKIIFGHSGWGPTLYLKDLFPHSSLLLYSEWFYRAQGSTHGFNPAVKVTDDNKAEIRTKNSALLLDLVAAEGAMTPTYWQKAQFPQEFQEKMTVIHDGVNTNYFQPHWTAGLVLPRIGLDLTGVQEVVTYVATGMEPMRGFPQLMEAVALIQRKRPRCHVVIVGEDRAEYSNPPPPGCTYRQMAMAPFSYDMQRLHFTGRLDLTEYRKVLWASNVHIYLTYPFILSWSMMEAMACGCLIVGSATAPVQEVIRDGVNGLLVDFFAPVQLAECVAEALAAQNKLAAIRSSARKTIIENYDLNLMLSRQMKLLSELAK